MTDRMSTVEYRRLMAGNASLRAPGKGKYKNKAVVINGKRFDRVLEGNYYVELLRQMELGHVLYFHRQVPIDLSMKAKDVYRVDFQVFKSDGTIEYIDNKGIDTQVFKLKRNLIEAHSPFTLKLVKSKDTPKHLDTMVPDVNGNYKT